MSIDLVYGPNRPTPSVKGIRGSIYTSLPDVQLGISMIWSF